MFTLNELPNWMTIMRIAITPLIAVLIWIDEPAFGYQLALALYTIASVTDYIDGYMARRLNVESPLGEMLDPIADKLKAPFASVLTDVSLPSIVPLPFKSRKTRALLRGPLIILPVIDCTDELGFPPQADKVNNANGDIEMKWFCLSFEFTIFTQK